MASTITLRNLDENTQRALRHRAVDNGRSLEAEIRAILTATARGTGTSPLFAAAEDCRASLADVDCDVIDALADAWEQRRNEQQREVFW